MEMLIYIKVEVDGKVAKIQGEMIVNDFVAFKDTIKHWKPPYDTVEIEEKIKQEIINGVINETKDSKFKITFK